MLRKIAACVLFLGLFSLLFCVGEIIAQEPTPPPEIDLSASRHDFGMVKVGYSEDWVLRIANRGLGRLEIYDITSNHPDFQITEPESFPQTVGYSGGQKPDSLYVTVTFSPSVSGLFNGRLTVISNDSNEDTLYVIVEGTGVAPEISLFETTHDFNGVVVGSISEWTLAINNTGPANLLITEIVSTDPSFAVISPVVFPQSIASGGRLNVITTFSPTSGGVKTANLIIRSDDPDESTIYVSLLGHGLAADISVSSMQHDFGELMVGNSTSWEVIVYNTGTLDLIISQAFISPAAFAIISPSFPQTVDPSGNLAVELAFQPMTEGPVEGNLTLRTNDPDQSEISIALLGMGIPRSPDITLSSASHDFGDVLVGSSSTWTLSIQNMGLALLNVNSIISDQAEFSIIAPTFPQKIIEGSSLDVTVAYAPTSGGERSGVLTVRSDDPDEPEITVSLFGRGVTPDAALSATSHDYGNVVLGASSVWPLTIFNEGTADLIVESVVSSHPNFQLANDEFPLTVPAGKSVTQAVVFSPSSLGFIAGNLTINTSDPTDPVLLVSLSGMGVKPDIFLSADSHEFGDVFVGSSAPWMLSIRNLGWAPLTITAIFSNNPVFTISDPIFPRTVEPGGEQQVTVLFTPVDVGAEAGNLSVISNDPETETLVIQLHGRGAPPPAPRLLLAENTHNYDMVDLGVSSLWRVYIYNRGNLDLEVNNAVSDNPDFRIVHPPTFPQTVGPLSHTHLTVDFVPSRAGTRTGHISVYSNDPENEIVSVTVTGYGSAPDIEVTSLSYDYGKVLLLNSQPWLMNIINQGTEPLTISAVRSDNEEFIVASPSFPQTLLPGKNIDVIVTFTPLSKGAKSGTITIASDDPHESVVAVQVAGLGVSTEIHVSDAGYQYGATAVGDTSTWSFIITNVGDEDLLIDRIVSSHPDFTVLSPIFPQQLRQFCGIEIILAFSPSSDGLKEGTLTVYNNDSFMPCAPLLISGTGIAPDIEVSAQSHDYGDVLLGQSRSWHLLLANTGTDDLILEGIDVGGGAFSIESLIFPHVVGPGDEMDVVVSFSPIGLGEHTGLLTIYSDDYNEGAVSVSLAGRGVSPEIELSEMDHYFGQLWPGDCTTWTFTITNRGSYDLIISNITNDCIEVTVLEPAAFPQKIHPGCDLVVTVSFCPTAVGERVCPLVIETNHPDVDQVTVQLEGEGVLPEIAASEAAHNFGGLAIGESSQWVVTISNRGTAPLTIDHIQLTNSVDFSIPDTYVFPMDIDPKTSFDLPVVFEPQSSTHKESDLIITSNDPNTPVLTLHLKGKGLVRDILLSDKQYEYGAVAVGQQSDWTFTVTNLGQLSLDLTEVVSSHSEFVVTGPAFPHTLSNGASVEVTVAFIPTSMGAKAGTLEVRSNDPDESVLKVTLSGIGVAPELELSSYSFDFGHVLAGRCSTWSIVVYNRGTFDLDLLSVTTDQVDFSASVPSLPLSIAPGDSEYVHVTFCPSEPGPATGVVTICVDGAIDDCIDIPLTGNGILQDIALSTTAHDYGLVRVGGMSNWVFAVFNDGTADLTIDDILSDRTEFGISSPDFPLVLTAGDSVNVIVAFRPMNVGLISAELTITSNDPDEAALIVGLQGEGALPDIELLATSYDFGNVTVGQSSPWTFRIANRGKLQLGISEVVSDHNDFAIITPAFPQMVAPGAELEIQVRFIPSSSGARSAIITVSSDDPDEGLLLLTLTGKGIDADILLSESTFDFGYVPVGEAEVWSFEVTNLGMHSLNLTEVRSTHADFTVTAPIFPLTLGAGASETVVVSYTPSSVGAVAGTLFVRSDDPDEGTLTVRLSGFGTSPDVEFSAYSHDFDVVLMGECEHWPVTATNTGTHDLEIVSATFDHPDFTIDVQTFPLTIAPGESQQWTITYCPSSAGAAQGNLTVCVDGFVDKCFTISLMGTSIIQDIAFSAPSHDFGPVYVGGTSNWALMILNIGTAELTVTDLWTDRSEFVVVSPTFPQQIPVGSSVGVVIAFTPEALGPISGNVTVSSDDPDEGSVMIPLTGEGVLPGFNVSELSHDFGTIIAGDSVDWHFTISNVGGARLSISQIVSDHTEFIVSDPAFPRSLGTGEALDVTVVFAPILSGDKSGRLIITTDDPQAPEVTVSLIGRAVVTDMQLSDNQHDFGQVLVGETSDWSLILTNGGRTEMTVLSITSDTPEFVVLSQEFPWTLEAGESASVGVEFVPSTHGTFEGTLTIGIADFSDDPPTVQLLGEGIQQDIDVQALTHDFGNVAVGDSSRWFLDITNRGTAGLTLDTLFVDHVDFALPDLEFPVDIAPGAGLAIAVTFRPSSAVEAGGLLTIVSNDPDEGEIVITLTGRGVDANVYASESFYDFGDVMLGGSQQWTFRVYNLGKMDLHLEDVISPCEAFRVESPEFPQTIGQGAHVDVTVSFNPTIAQEASCTLAVVTDDPDEGTLYVVVTGRGIGRQIAVTVRGIGFGAVRVGGSVERTLTVYNHGLLALTVNDIIPSHEDYTVVNPAFPAIIGPVDSVGVTVRFAPSETGPAEGVLNIGSDDPAQPLLTVTLSGEGIAPAVDLSATSHDYGKVYVGSASNWVLMIYNKGTDTLRISEVSSDNGDFVVHSLVLPVVMAAETRASVIVKYVPQQIGPSEGTLTIVTDDPEHGRLTVTLTGEGALPDIELSATSHDYGNIVAGDTSVWILTVSNLGTANLMLDSIACNAPDFIVLSPSFFPQTMPPESDLDVTVAFVPLSGREIFGQMTIWSSDPADPLLTVGLTGVGVAADLYIAGNDHNFGDVVIGDTATWVLPLYNIGRAGLIVHASSTQHGNFQLLSPTFPLTIQPGEHVDVTFNFTPTVAGPAEGLMTFSSNDVAEPSVDVTLSGNGVAVPLLTVTDGSGDPGSQGNPVYIDLHTPVPVAGVEFSLTYNSDVLTITDAQLTDYSGHMGIFDIAFPHAHQLVILVQDLDGGLLSPGAGSVVRLTMRVSPDAPMGVLPMNLIGVILYGAEGKSIPVSTEGGRFTVTVPDIDVPVMSHDYEHVSVNRPVDWSCFIHSSGTKDLIITAITTNHLDFTATEPAFPCTVAVAESVAVTFRFAPSAVGPRAAKATVVSNDPDESGLTISLTGIGIRPDICVGEVIHDFGEVIVGSSSTWAAPITNLGVGDLVIYELFTVGADFSVDVDPDIWYVVPERETFSVDVTFAPTLAEAIRGSLVVISNDPREERFVLPLWGRGVAPDIDLSAASHDFGEVDIGSEKLWDLTLYNRGRADLMIDSVIAGPHQFTVLTPEYSSIVAPRDSLVISTAFAPTIIHEITGSLSVFSNDPDERMLTIALRGRGAAPDIDLTASSYIFGRVKIGESEAWEFSITNAGTRDLIIEAVTPDKPDFIVTSPTFPLTLGPREDAEVQVSFQPLTVGMIHGKLTIVSNDPDEDSLLITMMGHGAEPEIELSAENLDFGGVAVDASAQKILVIRNTGDAELIVSEISTNNGDFSVDDFTFPVTVPKRDSLEVTVTFAPSAMAAALGSLKVVSDDASEPVLYVGLQGRGIPPATLRIGNGHGTPGSSDNAVFVYLDNVVSVATIRFLVNFDPDKLAVSKVQATSRLDHMGSFEWNSPHAGEILVVISDFGNGVIEPGSGSILRIGFDVLSEAAFGTVPLTLTGIALFDPDEINILTGTENGFFTVGTSYVYNFGDVALGGQSTITLNYELPGYDHCDLVIGRVECNHPDFTIASPSYCPMIVSAASGAEISITVIFSPTQAGEEWALIELSVIEPREETILLPVVGRGVAVAQQSWMVDILCLSSDVSLTDEERRKELTFGVDPDGSENFDPNLDTALPPLPPVVKFEAYFPEPTFIGRLSTDIRSTSSKHIEWTIETMGTGGTISWDPADLPEGEFMLNETVDMKSAGEGSFERNETLTIKYTSTQSAVQLSHLSVQFGEGWATVLWETVYEDNIAGFNVYRVDQMDIRPIMEHRLNADLITGTQSYSFTDKTTVPDQVYYYWVEAVGTDGTMRFVGSVSGRAAVPQQFALSQNYPNPFNPETHISYTLNANENVSLIIYNAIGQQVRTLVKTPQSPGTYTVTWNGHDDQDRLVPTGAYFYRITVGTISETKKMVMLK